MKKLLVCFIMSTFLFSCGGKNFIVNQVESHSYVLIKGDSKKEQVIIDNGQPLVLGADTKEYKLDDGVNASKLQINEGTHTIKIIRDGNVIIQRNFFVTPGNSFEVNL